MFNSFVLFLTLECAGTKADSTTRMSRHGHEKVLTFLGLDPASFQVLQTGTSTKPEPMSIKGTKPKPTMTIIKATKPKPTSIKATKAKRHETRPQLLQYTYVRLLWSQGAKGPKTQHSKRAERKQIVSEPMCVHACIRSGPAAACDADLTLTELQTRLLAMTI